MNFNSYVAALIIIILFIFALYKSIKNKGKCSGGCDGCMYKDSCRKNK
ncbi:FeoB-associated Cys-rich membrane protein [Anaerofustis sp. NSJ-163]|nr:FeoB-associated Cys-rich membrane protein [Anaerofustis sp. NSJ-163]MCO8193046.1 FeoB-associated Cys-rich membrane protein [Anaerofustis sp. NSJ-163]